MKKNILGLVVLIGFTLVNCNVSQKENDDKTISALLLLSLSGSGGSCSIGVNRGGRTSTASANPVVLSTTEQSITYSKVPVVPHSIGVVTFKGASVGNSLVFNTVDVADFDGDGSSSLPLVYTTGDCPIGSDKQIVSSPSTYYTRSVSGSSYTYTINQAGDYSFVIYQLIYPAIASTVKRN